MFGVRKAYRELVKSVRGMQQENDQLKVENAKLRELLAIASDMARDYDGDRRLLRELVRDYHRFADAMCAERGCDGCSQREEGACERGVLTSRECVLGVDE